MIVVVLVAEKIPRNLAVDLQAKWIPQAKNAINLESKIVICPMVHAKIQVRTEIARPWPVDIVE